MTMPLPNSWGAHLTSVGVYHVFTSELKFGDLVTFVAEAKCNLPVPAQRHLAMFLCSAQHQRQALGFDDGRVFGATVVGKTLTMYSSSWDRRDGENGKVVSISILSFLSWISQQKGYTSITTNFPSGQLRFVYPVLHISLQSCRVCGQRSR
jgi:hypothetical protein